MKKNIILYFIWGLILTFIFSFQNNLALSLAGSFILVITLFITSYIYKSNIKYSSVFVIGISAIGLILSFKIVFNDEFSLFYIFGMILFSFIVFKISKSVDK